MSATSTTVELEAFALIRGAMADALDAAGFRDLAAEGRALDGEAHGAWYRALCWARDRGHTADRAGGWLGVRIECLAWAARGMLLRIGDPGEARAFAAEWTGEADRWDGAPRCYARMGHIRGPLLPVDDDRCPAGGPACSTRAATRPRQLSLFGEVA